MDASISLVEPILSFLQGYKIKPTGRNQYRCNSPLRPDSNSGAFAVKIDPCYGGGGRWYDFVQDQGGNFIELARHIGIAVDGVAPLRDAHSTKRSFSGLAEYAAHQGVDAAVFRKAGWKEGVRFCPRHNRERPALIFPTQNGERARFVDGEEPRYLSPKEYERCWYGLQRAIAIAYAMKQPLVIANGEASTVVAQSYGLAALCIAGGGEKSIPSDLLDELSAVYSGSIIVALDTDSAGRRAAGKVLDSLFDAGFDAKAIDLGGGINFDLGNFCKLYQQESAATLMQLPDLFAPEYLKGGNPDVMRQKEEQIARLQDIILQQEREIQQLKDAARFRNDVFKNDKVAPSHRLSFDSLVKEVKVVTASITEDEEWKPISTGRMAKETGLSQDTINRHLRRFEEAGIIQKRVETIHDPETNEWYKTTYIKPLQDLNNPNIQLPESKHGGKRERCPDCGSDQIVERRQRYCIACQQYHGEIREVPINPTEADDEADETVFEDGELAKNPGREPIPHHASYKISTGDDLNTTSSELLTYKKPHDAVAPPEPDHEALKAFLAHPHSPLIDPVLGYRPPLPGGVMPGKRIYDDERRRR